MVVQQAARSGIEETNAQFMAAINRGDTAAIAALYTDEAIVMAPNAEMMRGKQAIKALFDGMIQQMGVPRLTLSTIQVDDLGDTACEIGAYTLKTEAVSDNGNYVVVWRREGGNWRLAVDIWNTNLPPAA